MGCSVSKRSASHTNRIYIIRGPNSVGNTQEEHDAVLLILGAANSGKSTLFKQMRMIHASGYKEAERRAYIPLIVSNIAESLKSILEIMKESMGEFYDNEIALHEEKLDYHCVISVVTQLNAEEDLLHLMKKLCKDKSIRAYFANNRELIKMPEAAEYFFNNIDRIAKQGYIPSDQDILHARLKSTGIADLAIRYEETNLVVLDVGGQRSERRKWIHYFEGIDVIMYLAALTDYDLSVEEEPDKNALEESLEVFASLINSQWFRKTPVLLFLNKMDRFESKIKSHPLNEYYTDFKGDPASYEDSVSYIKNKYLSLDRQTDRKVYCYATCATNTENIKTVLNVSLHTVLLKNLNQLFG